MSRTQLLTLLSSVVVGLVLLLAPHTTAYADNTEDLLNVYGLTLGGPVKSEIEKQIESLQNNLLSMQAQETMADEYNKVLSEYMASREAYFDSILHDVSVYQTKNDKIANNISTNLLESDISMLQTLDSQYKVNEKQMNELLSLMNNYQIDYTYKNVEYDISDVEAQLLEANNLYVQSLDVFDLGDVKNVSFPMDVDKYITSDYGYRIDPLNHDVIRFHSGTDYRATTGTPIHALFNGTVISAGWSDTCGNFITVQCGDNVKYFVCHCSELLVQKGDVLKQGDTIALVGGTGTRCTGPHLHLALYLNGVTYDVDQLFQ